MQNIKHPFFYGISVSNAQTPAHSWNYNLIWFWNDLFFKINAYKQRATSNDTFNGQNKNVYAYEVTAKAKKILYSHTILKGEKKKKRM